MAPGDAGGSRPKDIEHSGVNFCDERQTAWNAPKYFADLDSPGVVTPDTSVVPDVLGLKAFYDEAEPVRVLPGNVENIVRVLVPDARAEPRGVHDILLEDRVTEIAPAVSTADFCLSPCCLKCRSARPTWELQRRFSGLQAGTCSYCGRHIVNSMARHVMTYHLYLGQLWGCPVTWCSHWKGTPQDCIDHIHLRYHMGLSVKASNVGKHNCHVWRQTGLAISACGIMAPGDAGGSRPKDDHKWGQFS